MNRLHVATTGLFAAWMVHDLEALATMNANSDALVRRLLDWVPVLTAGTIAGGRLAAYAITKNQP